MSTPEEQNDAIRAQVNQEFPWPAGGFETEAQFHEWKVKSERRFEELAGNSRQVELDFDEILQEMESQAVDGQCIPPAEMMRDHIATLRRWKEAYDKGDAL